VIAAAGRRNSACRKPAFGFREGGEATDQWVRHPEKPPNLAVFAATGFRVGGFPVKLRCGAAAGRAPWTF